VAVTSRYRQALKKPAQPPTEAYGMPAILATACQSLTAAILNHHQPPLATRLVGSGLSPAPRRREHPADSRGRPGLPLECLALDGWY